VRTLMYIIATIVALVVPVLGHAESSRDLDCLAKNIYYEAGNQSEEGKVAVGLVTINRANDERFPNSICGVVEQRTVRQVPSTVTTSHVEHDYLGRKRLVKTQHTVWTKVVTCQFSWRCESYRKNKINPARWEESLQVAQALLDGEYFYFRQKYVDAMYFHEYRIKPSWAKQKHRINKVGAHIFYAERSSLTVAIQ
jgi:spore germination cell wall hydrolase CwlJ-like protein